MENQRPAELSAKSASQAQSLSVAQLLALAKNLLETSFLGLWIEGEVANFRPAPSGHWYFTLKDARGGTPAELKVAMFRGRNIYSAVLPADGMRLRLRGRLTVYEQRGELQMVAEQLEDAGAGIAAQALETLKIKLAAEGLFDAQFKKPLPLFPRRIALISSPTGAAVHDFLVVLARRFPLTQVEIWPSLVQGEQAPAQLLAALIGIHRHTQRYDVIVLTRGGGAAQDLAAFNDEALVRAVAASVIPVVSAVGHEIDVTLCDLAADLRAATPTAAAELITPDQTKLNQTLAMQRQALRRSVRDALEPRQQRLDYARRLLDARSPIVRLRHLHERLMRAHAAVRLALKNAGANASARCQHLFVRLNARSPAERMVQSRGKLALCQHALARMTLAKLAQQQHQLALHAARLSTLNPKHTLARGYVLVHDAQGNVLSHAQSVRPQDALRLRFQDGEVRAIAQADSAEQLD